MKKLKHIAIILDGNRRYAKKHMLKPGVGHKKGSRNVENLINWCNELKIKELTLYTFSVENFKRKKNELNFLMNLFKKQIKKLETDKRIEKNRVRVNFIGRLHLFPNDMQKSMKKVMNKTKNYNKFKLNLAMGYGGRAEIIDAVNKIINKKTKKVDEKIITKNLYLTNEPDLVIRTGGEKRVSNFLIWQSYYSEWYFTNKLWPEFNKKDLIKAIKEFKKRKRRYGE